MIWIVKWLERIWVELRRIRKLLEQWFALTFLGPNRLVIKGTVMTDVVVGKTAPFTVTCFDNQTPPVVVSPDPNGPITVSVDANGSATVNADGTGGVFTATAVGASNLTATDSVLTSAPFAFNCVAPPPVPTTLVITSP